MFIGLPNALDFPWLIKTLDWSVTKFATWMLFVGDSINWNLAVLYTAVYNNFIWVSILYIAEHK